MSFVCHQIEMFKELPHSQLLVKAKNTLRNCLVSASYPSCYSWNAIRTI